MGIPAEERTFAALDDGESYARLAASGFKLDAPKPIFPRLEAPADA
jgi:methionyl-tRNA synthetase